MAMTTSERHIPTKDEVLSYLRDRNNWGRWGADDQKGAINLITPAKRAQAAATVRSGRAVSLSREWPKTPGPGNPNPAQHWTRWFERENGGGAVDYYAISYHGFAATHIDALCHVWAEDGIYGGRKPSEVLTGGGARVCDVDQWRDGIITRGVLLDVTRHRGEPFVTLEHPVHGWELEEIAAAQGVQLEPGDALLVYSGREAWYAATNDQPGGPRSPGLHASCLPFIRDNDVALLGWDLMDAPNDYDIAWTVHGALFAYGVALLDNCLLQPLAEACAEEGRYTFMLTVAPLRVVGGTGSPANPLALF
jgi:kynurenine formamidase